MLKKLLINNIGIWEIIMSIFIIGLINIYFIHICGIEGIYPIIENIENWKEMDIGGIIRINEEKILYIILINILFYIIFNNKNLYNYLKETYNTEFIYLLSFGLLGLNLIILSNDLIYIFISLELYSLSVYMLILLKITKNTTRMSIIYLLINSLSSYIILLGISIIYKYTGSIILDEIYYIINNNLNNNINENINIGTIFIIIGLLIKLGTVPFNYWVLRLYTSLENKILLYQIIIPKLVYISLLWRILIYLLPISNYNKYINYIFICIYLISILSVIIASIGGLFNSYFKAILTYSSILNMGFILLGISNNIQNNGYINNFTFIEYLLIYVCNTFALFFCFLLINPESKFNKKIDNENNKLKIKNKNFNQIYPFFTICILISIFSFIGIPPFAGFFGKLNIFLNILNSHLSWGMWEWGIISLITLLVGTFISACFYLKFYLKFFYNSREEINKILISETPISISYYISFYTIFLIVYPFLSNYLYPLYILFLNK